MKKKIIFLNLKMSELIIHSDIDLKNNLINLKNDRDNFLKIINNINKDISIIEKELISRFKIERYKIVNEYKIKLQNILSEEEYNIIMDNIDKTEYLSGKIILIDIEDIYNEICKFKNKFGSSIVLIKFKKTGQVDTYPPESFYNYNFLIGNYQDIIIGNYKNSFIINNKILNVIKDKLKDSEFDFLNNDEKINFAVASELIGFNEIIKYLPRIKEIKNIFPNSTFNDIEINNDIVKIYIN